MTATAIDPSQPAADPGLFRHPADLLMSVVVAVLAPMFLCVTGGDIACARMAAVEVVSAYRTRNNTDLLAIAQIIGFGLAALGSLSLSMADNLTVPMTLRLRSNANALNRSAEQNRRTLGQLSSPGARQATAKTEAARDAAATRDAEDARYLAEAIAMAGAADADERAAKAPAPPRDATPAARGTVSSPPAAARTPPAPKIPPAAAMRPAASAITDRQRQAVWASEMAGAAEEVRAGPLALPPAEHRATTLRAAALSSSANALIDGANLPPATSPVLTGIARPNKG